MVVEEIRAIVVSLTLNGKWGVGRHSELFLYKYVGCNFSYVVRSASLCFRRIGSCKESALQRHCRRARGAFSKVIQGLAFPAVASGRVNSAAHF